MWAFEPEVGPIDDPDAYIPHIPVNVGPPLNESKIWGPIKLDLEPNPNYVGKKMWGYRPITMIKKIIIHQALSEADTLAIHNYHISEASHIKKGGTPMIAYHYTIEKDGTTYLVNKHTDITWHTKGQNTVSLGIMLCGDFNGSTHVGKTDPTDEQMYSLEKLLDMLTKRFNILREEVYGHSNFGKIACPGYVVEQFIKEYRG